MIDEHFVLKFFDTSIKMTSHFAVSCVTSVMHSGSLHTRCRRHVTPDVVLLCHAYCMQMNTWGIVIAREAAPPVFKQKPLTIKYALA